MMRISKRLIMMKFLKRMSYKFRNKERLLSLINLIIMNKENSYTKPFKNRLMIAFVIGLFLSILTLVIIPQMGVNFMI